MATAVQPGSEPQTPTPLSLPVSSLLGAIYVAAVVAIVLYGLPLLWGNVVGTQVIGNSLITFSIQLVLRVGVAVALIVFGRKLLGDTAQRGVRGGIFLVLVSAILVFLVWRFVAQTVNGMPGVILSILIGAALLFFIVRFFSGKKGEGWMVGLEEQGWFHAAPYKRILGQRVRRLTILGILLLGGSGIYTLADRGTLPHDWTMSMPFDIQPITVLPSAKIAVPLILVALLLWFAYRAVNVPTFAEFLLATEAEMNKVSWTPRKRLFQDTVVVLTTTLAMALFLLLVDLFWGWLLSNNLIGVLPARSTEKDKSNQAQQAKW
jgi:preprotein translocase SecE subunit